MTMTDKRKERVVDLRQQGHTYGEIAEAVGMGKTFVYRTLKEAGMIGINRISASKKREVIHLYERGLTYRQVAERTGVARSSCCEICQEAGVNRAPTEAQRRFHGIDDEAAERALDLYDAGMSREAIAKITGLKEHQITQYAKPPASSARPRRRRVTASTTRSTTSHGSASVRSAKPNSYATKASRWTALLKC